MSAYPKNSADRLYQSLPEIYRERDSEFPDGDDRNDHLYQFLGALGELLDQSRHTLEQRYRDNFPDLSTSGERCQDWLLPYFADLFAVNLTSRVPDSQRAEISNAVRWAKRKGTLGVINEISDAITLKEAVIQEGWKRVATTARIGMPLLTAKATGNNTAMFPDPGHPKPVDRLPPSAIATHPGIAAVTPDFRQHSRAVQTDPQNAAAQTWAAGNYIWPPGENHGEAAAGLRVFWRQANPHGAPCLPGSFQDVSQRCPDLRDASRQAGHFHPKNILIYLAPPAGFCTPADEKFPWNDDLDTVIPGSGGQKKRSDYLSRTVLDDGTVVYRNKTNKRIQITGSPTFSSGTHYRFERLRFNGTVTLNSGRAEFSQCLLRLVKSSIDQSANDPAPALLIEDSLMTGIEAPKSLIRTVYVTVMNSCSVRRLQASDCIFVPKIEDGNAVQPHALLDSCIRYSRLHPDNYDLMSPAAHQNGLTADRCRFYADTFCQAGYGVLAPETPKSIAQGAEDGGEMGAFHAWEYIAQISALKRKLDDYVPAGMRAVIMRDSTLKCPPPRQS